MERGHVEVGQVDPLVGVPEEVVARVVVAGEGARRRVLGHHADGVVLLRSELAHDCLCKWYIFIN